ncbi:MAG: hypothetical protein JNG83_12700 [Opitutaceae bacterium]|nr:hypothetical protein [Opitutaceae bacterium]
MTPPPVTLQISLAPSDLRHASVLLPHQVRAWAGQVAEVLLTIDFHRSAGRFAAGWEEGKAGITALAASIPGARVVPVDYAPAARARVGAAFFGGAPVPTKDFRGGPFYSYFFGLAAAAHDHVLHADSDMFFGGDSRTWIGEALTHLAAHPEVLFAAPLSGPPRPDGRLLHLPGLPEPGTPHAFRFADMSTRVFLCRRSRLQAAVGPLRPRRPPGLRRALLALLDGNPAQDLPEHLLSDAMRARGLVRREFLGAPPGRFTLHPPYRTADFYARLPELVRRVETGDLPPDQLGDHDLNSSLVDWSEAEAALRRNRWWRRLLRRASR